MQFTMTLWMIIWMPVLVHYNILILPVLLLTLFPAAVWVLTALYGIAMKEVDPGVEVRCDHAPPTHLS